MDRLQRDGYEFGSFQFFPASGSCMTRPNRALPGADGAGAGGTASTRREVVTREQLRAELWPEATASPTTMPSIKR